MKIMIRTAVGMATFKTGTEDKEPGIREAVATGNQALIRETIARLTTQQRAGVNPDEHVLIAEDDGAELWVGWLTGNRAGEPGPIDRESLESLADKWDQYADELVGDVGELRQMSSPKMAAECSARASELRACARQLRATIMASLRAGQEARQ